MKCKSGFTLIEVLASIAILIIIVSAMGAIFAGATRAYRDSMKQAERDAAARAAMDYIVRDVSQALFENPSKNPAALTSMRYQANVTPDVFGLEGADALWFLSASREPESSDPRIVDQVVYYVRNAAGLTNEPPNARYRFGLYRRYENPKAGAGNMNVYYGGAEGLTWSGSESQPAGYPSTGGAILENVRTFEVFAYENPNGDRILSWDSNALQPLFCMDIYIETLSEQDAERAALLADSLGPNHQTTVEFVESAVRRHFQRVYFPNKRAYYDGVRM